MLIDEKGRLFGKINFFDFMVTILLLTFIVGIAKSKLFKKNQPDTQPEIIKKHIEQDYSVLFLRIEESDLPMIKAGGIDNDGKISLIEVNKDSLFSYTIKKDTCYQIIATAKIKGEVIENQFYYNDQKIGEYSIIEFKPDNDHRLEGLIILSKPSYVTIKVRFRAQEKELIRYIKVGDSMFDSHNILLAQIQSIEGQEPYMALSIDNNSVKEVIKGEYLDLSLNIKILGELRPNGFYYGGNKIKIGSYLSFQFDQYDLTGGKIIDIY
ncbi:MAG: DUF4330 domain-containing protein [bacterium]